MSDPSTAAAEWLRSTYRGQVELAVPVPVAESGGTWLFACRAVPLAGYPATPMLVSTLAVPKTGNSPFHLATDDPWGDVAAHDRDPRPRSIADQARRTNARGCVVAAHAAVAGAQASPLPWKPSDEAPGWWHRLTGRYFPGAEITTCATWDEVIRALNETGPATRGVVWVRRDLNGTEGTGHLLYALQHEGQPVFLDAQSGGMAVLETTNVRQLTLARFQAARPAAPVEWSVEQQSAPGLPEALRKAEAWLTSAYQGAVVLNQPSEADELANGWLFACNTPEYLRSGDWREGMLDAALVVPKDHRRPFGLPNSDPWGWLAAWDAPAGPGAYDLPLPPAPGPAGWIQATMPQLGTILSVSHHERWLTVREELAGLPVGARAIVWLRRRDRRGRETVGLLFNAAHTARGCVIIDGTRSESPAPDDEEVAELIFLRYR